MLFLLALFRLSLAFAFIPCLALADVDSIRYSYTSSVPSVPHWSTERRIGFTVAEDGVHQHIWLFGGEYSPLVSNDTEITYLNDLWQSLDGGSTWLRSSSVRLPTPRTEARMAINQLTGQRIVVGGRSQSTVFNDVWVSADHSLGSNFTCTSSSAQFKGRFGFNMFVDPSTGKLIVINGQAGFNSFFNDGWISTDSTYSAFQPMNPLGWSPRSYAGAALLPPEDGKPTRGILVGGLNSTRVLDDIWTVDANGTTQFAGLFPGGPRFDSSILVDSQSNIWLFGGKSFPNGRAGGQTIYYTDLWMLKSADFGTANFQLINSRCGYPFSTPISYRALLSQAGLNNPTEQARIYVFVGYDAAATVGASDSTKTQQILLSYSPSVALPSAPAGSSVLAGNCPDDSSSDHKWTYIALGLAGIPLIAIIVFVVRLCIKSKSSAAGSDKSALLSGAPASDYASV